MDSDDTPLPDPSGALEPPRRNPPTALAVESPPPPRPPRSARSVLATLQNDPRAKRLVDNALNTMFDAADSIADEIAGFLRLRPRDVNPSRNLPVKLPPE
jgi:hypothetical protein